jgi:hypothetical protein
MLEGYSSQNEQLNFSRRCAEAFAVRVYQKHGLSLAPGMEIGICGDGCGQMGSDTERDVSELDAAFIGRPKEKARGEV